MKRCIHIVLALALVSGAAGQALAQDNPGSDTEGAASDPLPVEHDTQQGNSASAESPESATADGTVTTDGSATTDGTAITDGAVETGTEEAVFSPTFKLKLSGEHEFGFHFPVYDDAMDYTGEIKSPAARNLLGVEIQEGSVKLVTQWHLDFLANPGELNDQGQPGDWNGVTRIRPGENYLSWSTDAFKLAAGYQVFAWGVADKVNPTDNLNPRDYTVGVNADKIPLLAMDAIWYPTPSISLEAVFAPFEQADRWPIVWGNQIPDLLFNGKSFNFATLSTEEVPHDRLVINDPMEYKPENLLAGGKVNFRSSAVDFSLSYLYDFDPFFTPVFTTATEPVLFTGTENSTGKDFVRVASVDLERKRIHRFGVDAKTTLGIFGLWAEGAYSLTEHEVDDSGPAARRSRLDYVLGMDFSYGPNDTYYANIQYVGSWIPGYNSSFGSDYVGGLPQTDKAGDLAYMTEFYQRALVDKFGLDNQGMLHGLTLNLKFELLDALLTPQLTLAYFKPFDYDDSQETRYGSLALNPELDFKPVDSFHVKLGADLYYAWVKKSGEDDVSLDTKTDRLGIYTPSNNVYIQLEYKWTHEIER